MKITYDPVVDVLRILFSNAAIEESDEEKPGIILDICPGIWRTLSVSMPTRAPANCLTEMVSIA